MCKIEKFRNFVLAKREAPPPDKQKGAVKQPTTWKDAGVVDRDGLENRCTLWVPRVRIPVFPQPSIMKPAEFQRVSFVFKPDKNWLVPQISPPGKHYSI